MLQQIDAQFVIQSTRLQSTFKHTPTLLVLHVHSEANKTMGLDSREAKVHDRNGLLKMMVLLSNRLRSYLDKVPFNTEA